MCESSGYYDSMENFMRMKFQHDFPHSQIDEFDSWYSNNIIGWTPLSMANYFQAEDSQLQYLQQEQKWNSFWPAEMFPGNEPTPLQNWREQYHVRSSFREGPGESQFVATQGSEDTNKQIVAGPSKAQEKQQESQQPSRTRKYEKSKSKMPVTVYYAQQRDYTAISQAKKKLMSTNEWLQATPSDRTRLEKLSKQSVIENRTDLGKSWQAVAREEGYEESTDGAFDWNN